jgi:hypothetical protein
MGDKGLPVLLDQFNEVAYIEYETRVHGQLQILDALVDEGCKLIRHLPKLPLGCVIRSDYGGKLGWCRLGNLHHLLLHPLESVIPVEELRPETDGGLVHLQRGRHLAIGSPLTLLDPEQEPLPHLLRLLFKSHYSARHHFSSP